MKILLVIMAVCMVKLTAAQNCDNLGQKPGSAFPVCGTTVFTQSQVPICGNRLVPNPCNSDLITDKNPYWYKFTCYQSGTLGFEITPANLNDDYDWQLFDVTDANPGDVYTKSSLFVACNWSGEVGVTGASAAGNSLSVCEGEGRPLFSAMPDLIAGHQYLLLISHFTDSQSGYTLSFKGGSGDITDPKIPAMSAVTAVCTGNELRVKLNKPVKCASIAADGSDFSIASAAGSIAGAASASCNDEFTTDSIILSLNSPLAAGNYELAVKTGDDGNSLLDNCDNSIPDGTINFDVHENVSAQFTYAIKEGCERDTLELFHDGAHGANKWNWEYDNGPSSSQNTSVIYDEGGDRSVTLTVSNDFCTDVASQTISIPPHVRAAFSAPQVTCAVDKVTIADNSIGNVSSWQWNFGDGTSSTMKNPDPFNYPKTPGEKTYTISLKVSNDIGCTDTISSNILVVGNCNILVPTAFTPNNDGKNDYLFPTNAFGADNLVFRVYNRFGQMVFEAKDWQRKWDGNVNGQPQNTGTYVWTLSYTLRSTGRQYFFKGTTQLIR